MAGLADPPPRPRVRLDRRAYVELVRAALAETNGRCFCCGRKADSLHHLIGGPERSDELANVVPLAGDGVRLCHGALTSGNRVYVPDALSGGGVVIRPEDVRQRIRDRLEEFPEKLAYIIERKGEAWLERKYGSVSIGSR